MATTGQSVDTPKFNGPANWTPRPASESDLARGMLLLRASNMNVMRLQLAVERSDRRLAMEALDGLVALDGEIRGFIQDMPPADESLVEMTRRLDAQKAVLASEKLVFAAGRAGPSLTRPREIAPAVPVAEADVARSLDLPSEWVPAHLLDEREGTGAGRRFAILAAALLLLILAGVAATHFTGLAPNLLQSFSLPGGIL